MRKRPPFLEHTQQPAVDSVRHLDPHLIRILHLLPPGVALGDN